MSLKPGDHIRGIVSGKYLGEIVLMTDTQVIYRRPSGKVYTIGRLMVELVPNVEQETGTTRVWV
ncbi:MAG: hypothetical protein ABFC78_00525 [Methanoregula sp.]